MIKLATPVSHLFENKEYEEVIVKNSDVLLLIIRCFYL